jgi:murein DD-endopeptidase MepM/ murein hydrolase activator NlpD
VPPPPVVPKYHDDEAPPALVRSTTAVQQIDASLAHYRTALAGKRKALTQWAPWLAAEPALAKLQHRAAELNRLLNEQTAAGANALAMTALRIELAPLQVQQEILRSRIGDAKRVTAALTTQIAGITSKISALEKQRVTAMAALRSAAPADVANNTTRLQASSQLAGHIRHLSGSAVRTVNGTGVFARPATGPVTSDYGMRYHPILHYTKLHTGIDFGRGDGFVYAADNGVVIAVKTSPAYGLLTIIDHGTIRGRAITTMYAHQSRSLVPVGQRVARGQRVGVIGATGYATGPHLHFEVRDGGAVVDPRPWL